MRTIKGPGIFLSQFISAEAPFNSLDGLAGWAAGKGYKAVQIPCNHPHIFDVEKAAESQAYCDDITGTLAEHGLAIPARNVHWSNATVRPCTGLRARRQATLRKPSISRRKRSSPRLLR